MNRTITMNLSGIIFHIEEDAYETLSKYLTTIKGYFKSSDGRDEIMHDIEARIAEMLQEKVSTSKQAILLADVESVIAVMGKPEDFAGENTGSENSTHSTASSENSTFNTNGKRRRLFRDPDDKVIGGVCSGIASYFDFDPIWLRAAFAISFFVFGSGFLLYIILMMIIPKAKTTAEKLEMRGEKVNVDNISKAVHEEFEDFKKRMKDWGDEVKSPENKERIKSSARKAGDFITEILHSAFSIFGKVIAGFCVFIGIVLMIALLATIFGSGTLSFFGTQDGSIHFSLYELSAAILPKDLSIVFIVVGLLLFLGIPLLSIIYSGIKHLFGIKQKNKIVKYTANVLWLLGLGLLLYSGIEIGKDFSEEASVKQKIELVQPKNGILCLDIKRSPEDELDMTFIHHRRIHFGDWGMFSKDEHKFRLGYPSMDIVPSETDSFELIAIKSADGPDKKEAASRAKNIDYFITQEDSIIKFDSFFDVAVKDKLHGQGVKLILKVPVGKTIFLSKRMEKIIFNIENVNDALDDDMVNRRWIMTKRGLECIDCDGLENSNHHPAAAPQSPSPSTQEDSDKKIISTKV